MISGFSDGSSDEIPCSLSALRNSSASEIFIFVTGVLTFDQIGADAEGRNMLYCLYPRIRIYFFFLQFASRCGAYHGRF